MSKINLLLLFLLGVECIGKQYIEKSDGQVISSKNNLFKASNENNETAVEEYIGLYQKYISAIRGHECQMYPSCSNFGLKTFKEKKFATAFVLSSERLMRCSHDKKFYGLTIRPNGIKLLDYPSYEKPPKELIYVSDKSYFAHTDFSNRNDSTILFVKSLINNSFYQEALLEIKRITFKNQKFNLELFMNEIICLKALKMYEQAIFAYEMRCPSKFKKNGELLFQIATVYYKLQNFDQALNYCEMALEDNQSENLKSKLLLLKGLCLANKSEWQSSRENFEKVSSLHPSYQLIAGNNVRMINKETPLKHKSKFLATFISFLIPGSGYAYAGHSQSAISALLINGLLTYATYTSIKRKNYGLGALTGFFGFSFYVGNIYGAKKSVDKYNQLQKKKLVRNLEYNYQF